MKRNRFFYLFLILPVFILMSTNLVYALGDGSASSTDLPIDSGFANLQKERGHAFILSGGYEDVLRKPLENSGNTVSGRVDGYWTFIGMGYRVGQQFEPYLRLGMSDLNLKWNENSNEVEISGDSSLAIGAGIKALAYKRKLTSLLYMKLNLDSQIRYTDADFDKVIVATASRTVSAKDFSVFEWRTAATVGFEILLKKTSIYIDEEEQFDFFADCRLVPYVGVSYVSSTVNANFTDGGTRYQIEDVNDKANFHLLAGIDVVAPKYVLLNIESQFFDGESVSGGATIKF